ncbi:MAG: hypothetical protein QOG55_1156 [Acidobacteriaceae bacterium]|nr:hypothetical protein [Acidobacteriaceae bacterium]
MVGAKGFEPSTSWSRTKYLNPINALSGVAYGTRSVISPLLVVRNLYVALQTWSSNLSVNSHLSNLITICRSGSFPRRIKQLRSSARVNFSSVFTFCLRFSTFFHDYRDSGVTGEGMAKARAVWPKPTAEPITNGMVRRFYRANGAVIRGGGGLPLVIRQSGHIDTAKS